MGVVAILVKWPRCGDQTFVPPNPFRLHVKFGFGWPSGFWGEDVWGVFPKYMSLWKQVTPWGKAIFDLSAIIWIILVEVHKIKLHTKYQRP